MKRFLTTTSLLLLLGMGIAPTLHAQDPQLVTVREINAIPQENIDQLNAAGANLTLAQIEELTANDLIGEVVQFTAVVLTDPRNSGLANLNSSGVPGRVHIYVRDTTAVHEGPEGMGIQVVPGHPSYQDTGAIDLAPGDVVTVVGTVARFGTSLQITPNTITFEGTYEDLGLPETLLDPVVITTADANRNMGDGQVQVNWDNLASLNGQYVRLEGATVLARDISDSDRPNWLVTTDGGETVLSFYDLSLRYRNDRVGEYDENTFNVRDDDFVPPPPGSVINLTGTIIFQQDDPFAWGVPSEALLNIAPWSDMDLEITETPPDATPMKPASVPGADEPTTITAEVIADAARTLTGVTLTYFTSEDATEMDVVMANTGGDIWEAVIPGQPDGAYVFYRVTAEDNTGATFTSGDEVYRVLEEGIDEIADIQATYQEAPGDSPFAGMAPEMDITATVQSDPAVSGLIAIQDNADLNPWTGILVDPTEALLADLQQGDVINITSGEISENFGVTELSNITYTTVTEGGDPLGYKEVTTDALQDDSIIEAHEGMMLRFNSVLLVSPDEGFGEWSFATSNGDGTYQGSIKADDSSDDISSTFAIDMFTGGEILEFVQGIGWFSFSEFKLLPETSDDVGMITNVASEDDDVPGAFVLRQNYPNPFNPATTIAYTVATTGDVRLEVFDLLGRSVAVLVDGQQVAGTYTLRFDGTGLASGIYVYRLSAGIKTTTRKMLLLK